MSLRDHLQAIYDERGELTPALVVDVARDNRHPLHTRFDWVNNRAAERWRQHQAQELIRSVRVIYQSPKTGEAVSIRAFQSVRDPDTQKYVYQPTEVIAQNPMMVRLKLAEMRRDWEAFKRRYDESEEFWDMVGADLLILA